MFDKVILVCALLALVGLPLAHSLKCWICADETCQNPAAITCDALYANVTRDVLKFYYDDVKDVNSTDYSCFVTRFNSNGTNVMDIRGCIMTGAFECGLAPKNSTWTKDMCKTCKKDSCNVPNAVGGLSASAIVIAVLLAMAAVFK